MRRFLYLSLVTTIIVTVFLSFQTGISATMDTPINIKLESGLDIYIDADGRLLPIEEFDSVDDESMDEYLIQMGFPKWYVDKMTIEDKEYHLSLGGKVVYFGTENLTREYQALDGTIYEVSNNNIDEIRDIQEKDFKILSNQGLEVSPNFIENQEIELMCETEFNNGCSDGKWMAYTYAVKLQDFSSTQYRYLFRVNSEWSDTPVAVFYDSMGMHWGVNGQPVGQTAYGKRMLVFGSTLHEFNLSVDESSNFGLKTGNILLEWADYQNAYIEQQVLVSKSLDGHQLALSSAYTHPWTPGTLSVSIGIAGISFSGIGIGDRWSWTANFTVGN
ncbi:hypothetical protein [Bacillus horti]|uniref:Uncharacterized protein n=1 Tax=Caldalkalibacillus horti TaxID=77523 RepID=A0ABT9W4L4_9BACI|nr:hypothetical protein [Bacillus horti]MDQ0168004.1 hypothetical protein [Bacillus horti]